MPDRGLGFLLTADRTALAPVTRLIESFSRYAAEPLVLFVVVPDEDTEMFAYLASDAVRILPLSTLGTADRRPGVVSLAFWQLDLADAYVAVPSDLEFLRPFGRSDFLNAEGVAYLFGSVERDLRSDPDEGAVVALEREACRRRAAETLGGSVAVEDAYDGPSVLDARVLRSLKADALDPAGLQYGDLVDRCPDAAAWHDSWLVMTRVVPFERREPVVKVIRTRGQVEEYALKGIGRDDLARGYAAVVNASGYRLHDGTPRHVLVGRAMQMRHLRRALALRLLRRAPRVQRLLGMDVSR